MTDDEIKALPTGTTVQDVMEKYLQPDWCGYPDALNPMLGCWSLTDPGIRPKISHEFCKKCECYNPKITNHANSTNLSVAPEKPDL